MKAIRVREFGPPSVMKIEQTEPPRPDSGQVLVQIKAAGINPVDTYIRAGTYARKKPDLPYTPGFDAAGVVESVGPGVHRFKPGDRVFTNATISGAYAEKAVCAEQSMFHLPDHLSFEQGAGVWVPYATAYYALHEVARARAGETLLVHGASGGVGTAAVQMAVAMGMTVIGSAGSEQGLELVRKQGAAALNHHDANFAAQVLSQTGENGAQVILEMLANVNLAMDLAIVAARGRIVVIGNRGTIEINPRDAMLKNASILGMLLMNITPEETARAAAGVSAGLQHKTLTPVVGKIVPLAEAPQAHEAVLAPGAFGKIVLIP